jgi:hypothetical protein
MNWHGIQTWLGQTPMAAWVRDSVSTKALLESAHILGNAVILVSVGILALRLMGLAGRGQSVSGMSRRFSPWIWTGVVVVFVTGVVLLTGAGRRGLDNPMFQVKLVTMTVAILITAALQLTLASDAAFWELSPARRAAARLIAPVCFLAWIATVFAGRWLAYSTTFFAPTY